MDRVTLVAYAHETKPTDLLDGREVAQVVQHGTDVTISFTSGKDVVLDRDHEVRLSRLTTAL